MIPVVQKLRDLRGENVLLRNEYDKVIRENRLLRDQVKKCENRSTFTEAKKKFIFET